MPESPQQDNQQALLPSQTVSLQDEATDHVKWNGKIVVNVQDNPVTYTRLWDIVNEYTEQNSITFDETFAFLDSSYNVQNFAKPFTELLNNRSEAWCDPEQQINFST